MSKLDVEYVLPLRWTDDADLPELTRYLTALSGYADVTVVDGSPEPAWSRHRTAWPERVRQLGPEVETPNRKVGAVLTGLATARHDLVVLADDDVRWTRRQLERMLGLLHAADVVRPQNRYEPRPWFARLDEARILIGRAFGGDWPGTLGVRRAALPDGYPGDVLFENRELVLTVRRRGGTELVALDLVVERRPPTLGHFLGQRVRQAYDDFAQPPRLLAELALLPLLLALARHPAALLAVAVGAVAVAEAGRRRAGGTRHYPASGPLWAPLWAIERAVCVWIAVGYRLLGGMPYAGSRLRRAGSVGWGLS